MGELEKDPKLLKGFREGRREALERIYREHVRSVDGYLRTLARTTRHPTFSRSGVVADLVQDVFIRAFSPAARRGYDGVRGFLPYILTIARNCFIDLLRASGREVPKSEEELASLIEQTTVAPEPDRDGLMFTLLNAYLADLSPALRAVYQQRYVLGRSQEESSAALGISRRAVRTAEVHLRKGLRKALARAGIGPGYFASHDDTLSTRIARRPVMEGDGT